MQARTRGPTSSLPAAWCLSVMGRRTTRTTTRVTVRAQIGPFVSWASTFRRPALAPQTELALRYVARVQGCYQDAGFDWLREWVVMGSV